MSEAASLPQSVLKRLWQRAAPLLVVNVFYFGTIIYPVLRIWDLLAGRLPGTPVLIAIMVGPLLGRLSYEFFPGTVSRWLSSGALTWLGICFMAFPLVHTDSMPDADCNSASASRSKGAGWER